jgi:hypothetical protein
MNGEANWTRGGAGANPQGAKAARAEVKALLALLNNFPPFTSKLFPTFTTMAIARPIRMLGAACILLTLFLVFQLRQGSDRPSSKLAHGMTRDPLLDRALPLPRFFQIEDSRSAFPVQGARY